jgi:uncharacterized protein (UPF0305 family)
MKIKIENNLAQKYSFKRNDLEKIDPMKEIVLDSIKKIKKKSDNHLDRNIEQKKTKNKKNLIEELKKFDMEEQIKIEEYISKRRRKKK